jgi:hypothetical protein
LWLVSQVSPPDVGGRLTVHQDGTVASANSRRREYMTSVISTGMFKQRLGKNPGSFSTTLLYYNTHLASCQG